MDRDPLDCISAPTGTTMSPGAPIQVGGVSCVAKTCIAVGSTGSSPVRTLSEREM